MTNQNEEKLLTVAEVAGTFKVDDITVRRWIASGALEAVVLPQDGKRKSYRVKRSTIDALLNQKSA